jgi:SAM-dependent methyltransferase
MSGEWWKEFFDRDYLPFHRDRPYQKTEEEVRLLLDLLGPGEGRRLLDVCCGPGRHAIPMAKAGWKVVGVDASAPLLELARGYSKQAGLLKAAAPRWIRADVRDIPLESSFDAAICMFTSIGFCEREEDHARILREVFRALKPGGKFVLDLANRDCMILVPTLLKNWWEREDAFVLEETTFESATSLAITRNVMVGKDGKVVETAFRVRLYSVHEMLAYLEEAGFEFEGGYGSYDGQPLGVASRRMILVSRKPGRE